MDDHLSMDELWEDYVKESRRNSEQECRSLQAEAYAVIRDLRVEHGTYIDIEVLVPWCSGCIHFESKGLERHMPIPDILFPQWKQYYRDLGLSAKEIAHVWRGIRDGWKPICWQCGHHIELADGVYVRRISLSDYFSLFVSDSRRPPTWLKNALRETFGIIRGECGTTCTESGETAFTFDHIVARSRGGLTEATNLQPLCRRCHVKKANQEVVLIPITLIFPLRPSPSDGLPGVVW
jgi:hypothetical protein